MTNAENIEDVPCPLGCQRDDSLLFEGNDILNGMPGVFTVVQCRTCGLIRTNPRPTPQAMGAYYPDDYAPYVGTMVGEAAKSVRHSRWKLFAKKLIETNEIRIPNLDPGRMLEVGCASGVFLHRMASQGWSVSGIETSAVAAENARKLGYDVFCGFLEVAPDPVEKVDLVVGWMVLEHLHDPVGALRKLNQWSKPEGWLVVSTPNAASLEFKVFKNKWYALQLPTHTYHFTPKTIAKVLDMGGWEVVKIYHQRNINNFIASLGYVLEARGLLKGLANRLIEFPNSPGWMHYALYPAAYLASFFGQTGRMTVWARKKSD